jgi:hypothetical protein
VAAAPADEDTAVNAASASSAAVAAAAQEAAAAAQRVAAAERAARDAEARAAAAEQQSAAVLAAAAAQAQVSASVPADVAALLSRLSLSKYGPALVDALGVASVAAAAFATDADLASIGMKPVERRMFLSAAAAPAPNTLPPAPAPAPAAAPVGVRARVRALVIGINAYAQPVPGALDNAVADAQAVHAALSALPGAASTLLTDCSKVALEAALIAFRDGTGVCKGRGMSVTDAAASAAAAAASKEAAPVLGVFFFAGHGLQVSGRNYLVPSDFCVPSKTDNSLALMLKDTARACVSLDAVEEAMEDACVSAGAVLLDCCRNVPDFLAALGATRGAGGGSATRALPAGMGEASPRVRDLMVTFATALGTCALDRSRRAPRHSPFTAALLQALSGGGAPKRLLELNPFLTDAACENSGGAQRPHVGGSYGTEAGNLLLG